MRCISCDNRLTKFTASRTKPDGNPEDMCPFCRGKSFQLYSIFDFSWASESFNYTEGLIKISEEPYSSKVEDYLRIEDRNIRDQVKSMSDEDFDMPLDPYDYYE